MRDVLLQPEPGVFIRAMISSAPKRAGVSRWSRSGRDASGVLKSVWTLAAAAGKRGDRFQDGFGTSGGPAIYEQYAIGADVGDDGSLTGDSDDVKIIGEFYVTFGGRLG